MGKEFAASQKEKDHLAKHLPMINKINDPDIKDRVYGVLARVLRESAYQDISDVPNFTTELMGGEDDETFVRHTSAVVGTAMAFAKELQSAYNASIDYDILLAGAILHDVEKPVAYARNGNVVELTPLGRKTPHGEYGALMAEQAGLPQPVINIIASHSPTEGKIPPASIEAVIVGCCDAGVFQSYRLMTGRGLWRKT